MPERREDPEDLEEATFPWEDVAASWADDRLQSRHPAAPAKKIYLARALACPDCGTPADRLSWFYFKSPEWTWEHLCGRAGWMVVCERCRRQVNFFCELMN
jgi:hypothetical protein|uniref:Uncharacterized protein n=1 Tax=Desulfobacca acetoxidans TaxID=60893 RepID=A0A7C3V544_9BACT